ncbi:hypothetical protein EB061_03775 [bacterium]|nr:hypothetical protein [bacterium]
MRGLFSLLFLLTVPTNECLAIPRRPASHPVRNIHGSYSVSYMGPRINGPPYETYNVFLNDISSPQLFHSMRLGYQIDRDLQIGFGGDASQNLVDGVTGWSGTTYTRSVTWYDPYLYLQFPGLFSVPGWSIFNIASMSLPVGQVSIDAGKITSLTFQQSWSKSGIAPWRFSFQIFLNPQLYSDPLPSGFTDRQTFYAAMGPGFGLELAPEFVFGMQTNLTVEHRSPSQKGWTSLQEAIPDTLKTSLTWFPRMSPMYASIGAYLQSVLWSPSYDTSIVGANLSLGF